MDKYIRIEPEIHFAILGDTVEFVCSSIINVWWIFKHGPLPNNAKTGVRSQKNGTVVHWLKLFKVSYQSSGAYQCTGVEEDLILFQAECTLQIVGMLHYVFS